MNMIDTIPVSIDELVQLWLVAFHRADAESLSATFAEEGVYIPLTGPFPVQGRDAIRAVFEGYFQTFPHLRLSIKNGSRRDYGNTVIYNCNWTLMYADGKGLNETVYGWSSSADTIIGSQRLFVLMATSLFPRGVGIPLDEARHKAGGP